MKKKKIHVRSRRSLGFRVQPLYRRKPVSVLTFLSRRFAFWTAMFSLLAFVIGNQVGRYGVDAVKHAVFGDMDDSLISYDGTVSPLPQVPDYTCWKPTNWSKELTFSDVPSQCLQPLPAYDVALQRSGGLDWIYSVGYMGSYATGADGQGSHPGVDIRAPLGTPVRAAMKGMVDRMVRNDVGFGNYVVIKTANAPDPLQPGKMTTLWTTYAHLDSIATNLVTGQIIERGAAVGTVGHTGDATGNHLHLQIDRPATRDGVEISHPTWPFTYADEKAAGLSMTQAINAGLQQQRGYSETISPVLYVQANRSPTVVAEATTPALQPSAPAPKVSAAARRRDARLVASAKRATSVASARQVTAAHAAAPAEPVSKNTAFATIELETDGSQGERREWKTVQLIFRDADGKRVDSPLLTKDLYLRTAFGTADFDPPKISQLDIVKGVATVRVLAHSPTVVIQVQPMGVVLDRTPLTFAQR